MSETAEAVETGDYESIEEAVLASTKGRWFLQEFARRNRSADTNRLLDAIEKLYEHARQSRESAQLDLVQRELTNTHAALQETRRQIAALHEESNGDIDDPAQTSARAAADIAVAAERLQEIAAAFRRHNMDADLCDEMDMHVAGIFMAGSYQDMIATRVASLSDGFADFERRLSAILNLLVDAA
jgi:chemotaxis protein CheZ